MITKTLRSSGCWRCEYCPSRVLLSALITKGDLGYQGPNLDLSGKCRKMPGVWGGALLFLVSFHFCAIQHQSGLLNSDYYRMYK